MILDRLLSFLTFATVQAIDVACVGPSYYCSETSGTTEIDGDDHLLEMSLLQRHTNKKRNGRWHEKLGEGDANKAQELVFVHIPKNAGTSIEQAALQYGYHWGHEMVYPPQNHTCGLHHLPPKYLEDPAPYVNAELFAVIRHPYDRAFSEYTYLVSGGNQGHGKLENDPPRIIYHISHIDDWPICSVEGLNRFTQRALRSVMDGMWDSYDCHYLPQSEYIWDNDRQWIKDLLRIEELPDSFNALMESKGNPTRLGEDRENNQSSVCPDITRDDFNKETRAMLDYLYRKDFENLAFEMT